MVIQNTILTTTSMKNFINIYLMQTCSLCISNFQCIIFTYTLMQIRQVAIGEIYSWSANDKIMHHRETLNESTNKTIDYKHAVCAQNQLVSFLGWTPGSIRLLTVQICYGICKTHISDKS